MAQEIVNILFPVGRLVWGHPSIGRDKDSKGKPYLDKQTQQPVKRWGFGVAIPKVAGQDWRQTEWGAKIFAEGQRGFPGGQYQRPDFSWKITDGDSQIPNKEGNKPCDNEGYPGHWVIAFNGSFAPQMVNANGTMQLTEQERAAIKCGDYVQVYGSTRPNTGETPGVYVNYDIVALSGFGPEIVKRVNAAAVGFGGALPPGASATPVAAMTAPAPAAPAPVAVTPNHQFAAPPAAPVPPTASPAPAGPVMTAKANGATYQSFRDLGWTDEQMRAEGYLV